MTKEVEETIKWVLEQVRFVDVMAKMHVDNFKQRADQYKIAEEVAESNNNSYDALGMACWYESSKYSEEHADYMRREVKSLIDRLEAQLPFVPTLTLVVDNTKKAPAGTGAQHIAKNAREKYDRNE